MEETTRERRERRSNYGSFRSTLLVPDVVLFTQAKRLRRSHLSGPQPTATCICRAIQKTKPKKEDKDNRVVRGQIKESSIGFDIQSC